MSDYLNPKTGVMRLKMTARASASKATLGGIIFALTSEFGGCLEGLTSSLTSSSPTGTRPDYIEVYFSDGAEQTHVDAVANFLRAQVNVVASVTIVGD